MNNKKKLKDMTLEELWELFPIVLTRYMPQWKEWAESEIETLKVLLTEFNPIITHIGSTAVGGILAKPIVDILVEIPSECDWNKARDMMEAAGYICMSRTDERMSFNKGYTEEGYADKVFHIHFHVTGDDDEIYFRDYLISHLEIAVDYEKLKLSLLPKYRKNRDGYTKAKTDFISHITKLARASTN